MCVCTLIPSACCFLPTVFCFWQTLCCAECTPLSRSAQVVNFLNSGDKRLGNAPGFKLDALLKLADTKSPYQRKYTLLHYVVEHCDKVKPGSVEAASRSLACCEQAYTYPFEMVDSDVKKLAKDLKDVEQISSRAPTDDPADCWRTKMAECIDEWRKNMARLDAAVGKLVKDMEQVCVLWCVDKKPAEAETCFENLSKLMNMSTGSLEELRKEKMKAESHKQKSGKQKQKKKKGAS